MNNIQLPPELWYKILIKLSKLDHKELERMKEVSPFFKELILNYRELRYLSLLHQERSCSSVPCYTLNFACCNGDVEFVKWLLDRYDFSGERKHSYFFDDPRLSIVVACKGKSLEVIELLVEKFDLTEEKIIKIMNKQPIKSMMVGDHHTIVSN